MVFAPHLDAASMETAAAELATSAAADRLAKALREMGRVSDAIGRLGPTEFAVIAQGTDAEGAVKLAERLSRMINDVAVEGTAPAAFRMRAGYDAVPNYHDAPIEPADMLVRATIAMRTSQAEADGSWIRSFEPRFSN